MTAMSPFIRPISAVLEIALNIGARREAELGNLGNHLAVRDIARALLVSKDNVEELVSGHEHGGEVHGTGAELGHVKIETGVGRLFAEAGARCRSIGAGVI